MSSDGVGADGILIAQALATGTVVMLWKKGKEQVHYHCVVLEIEKLFFLFLRGNKKSDQRGIWAKMWVEKLLHYLAK